MDELKIVTGFTKNLVAQLLEKLIKEGCGHDVKINLYDLKAIVTEEKASIHLNVDAAITEDGWKKMKNKVGGIQHLKNFAWNVAFNGLLNVPAKENLEKYLREELKKRDVDAKIKINRLKIDNPATKWYVWLEADGEIDCEEITKILKKSDDMKK